MKYNSLYSIFVRLQLHWFDKHVYIGIQFIIIINTKCQIYFLIYYFTKLFAFILLFSVYEMLKCKLRK